ncbi:MAG: 23S rRNA (uracil(1939)-C(5))-methyltransferase RlmD [Bacteroidota bacterium]
MKVKKQRKAVVLNNLTVTDYAAEGKSLSRLDGKVIFIEGAIPGDIVDVLLKKNKSDWAEGVAIHFHQFSPHRLTPFCRHFGVCGGCQWQMLPYAMQLEYKQQQVSDVLQRIGKVVLPAMEPILGAERTTHYRNKLEYTFGDRRYIPPEEFSRMKSSGEIEQPTGAGGFHARGFFDKVVAIETCHLQDEPTNAIRSAIETFARDHHLPFYNPRTHEGWLRNLVIRNTRTGEWMVDVVLGYPLPEYQAQLTELLQDRFPGITTLLVTINSKHNDSLTGLEPVVIKGNGYITEQLEKFRYIISARSFFQTNSYQAERLYRLIREMAELNGSQVVYDLYCGTGSIGIFLSEQAKQIVGVEVVPEAVADAIKNATLNGVAQARFFAGDVVDICDDAFFAREGKPDVVITDPPRAGMHEKLVKKLLEMEAPLIVYVSCNPATQARDLALLDEKYRVTRCCPVDMFPHTLHIENVVQLKLK